jgi:hypothetical protein
MRVDQGRPVFPIAPALVMPSMPGRPQDGDQALFWRRLHVPCWAMAHVCGHEAMDWYRLEPGLGRVSLVGTTVQPPEHLPTDLGAAAKQSWGQGERVYLATTAAHACLLGASVAPSASQRAWETASGVFARAAQALDAEEAPETGKTDGWQATPGAWQARCTHITVLLCCLQALLTIRARATTTLGDVGAQGQTRGWKAYHAPNQRAFSQRLRRFEGLGPDGTACRCDAEPYPGVVRKTCSGQ